MDVSGGPLLLGLPQDLADRSVLGLGLDEHVRLERTDCIATDAATHLRFRVVK